MQLPTNLTGFNIALLGVLTTAVGTLIVQLREYPKKLYELIYDRFVFTATVFSFDHFYAYIENWLGSTYPNAYRNVSVEMNYSELEKKHGDTRKKEFSIKHIKNRFVIKRGGKYIVVAKDREKMEMLRDTKGGYIDYYVFKAWRGSRQTIALFNEILRHAKETDKVETKIYQNDSYCWCEVNSIEARKLDTVVLNPALRTAVVNDISEFYASAGWYKQRGIPYKRTYLLQGPPGTGKTSLALALAEHFGKDVCFFSINAIQSDASLRDVFGKIKNDSILLIEDCDKLFTDRDSKDHKISFSAFINCLDGALYKRGLVTILTTNHADKLDPALAREGRIDVSLEITNPTADLIREYLDNFYGGDYVHVKNTVNISMAKVQEICLTNRTDKYRAAYLINLAN